MPSNVIHLPRPREARDPATPIGLFIRIGRNQHREMLHLLAEGERGFNGLIIDAPYTYRHRELIAEARQRGFEVILDPKTQAMATPGGHTPTLSELPWALDRPHRVDDFDGVEGRTRADQIAEFTVENKFTQILGPTRLLQSPNDPWLRRDISAMSLVRASLDRLDARILLGYTLCLPIQVLRDPIQRRAVVAAITDAPFDALWLRIENFGSDATGDKMAAYIDACRDFHPLGVPLIADHVGGLVGLGLLAFGAVSGIAHGITLLEGFKASHWRREPKRRSNGGPVIRIYIPPLDLLMKRRDAEVFLNTSTRIRGRFGCRDTHCCPRGLSDMLNRPARHFLHQRSRQIEGLSGVPRSLRVNHYLEEHVRRVSDEVAAVTSSTSLSESLRKRFHKKQGSISRFRQAMGHLSNSVPVGSTAIPPVQSIGRVRDQE